MSELKDASQKRVSINTPPPDRDSETVTVACNLPNGIILHLCGEESSFEPLMGGGYREIKRYPRLEETVHVKGCAVDVNALLSGRYEINKVGGYALTTGVPKHFWDRWLDANKETDLVRNKVIFAAISESRVRSEAKEYDKVQSGLEPIDPQNPSAKSRELRNIQKMSKTET